VTSLSYCDLENGETCIMSHTPPGSCSSGKFCQRMTTMTEVTGEIFRNSERMPRMSEQRLQPPASFIIIGGYQTVQTEGNFTQSLGFMFSCFLCVFFSFYVLTALCYLHATTHPPTIYKWRQNCSQHW